MSVVFEESRPIPAFRLFFQPPKPVIVASDPTDDSGGSVGNRAAAGEKAGDPTLELVQRALAGSEEALTVLVDQLTPVIQARVSRSLLRQAQGVHGASSRETVKDLTQEIFVELFKNEGKTLRRWDPQRGASLENFVGFITERRVISILRRGKNSAEVELPNELDPADGSPAASPERWTASRELLACIVKALRGNLSTLGWTMFEMLFVWGGSVEEVSRELDMSRDAVRKWRSRLRKQARECAKTCEGKGWAHG